MICFGYHYRKWIRIIILCYYYIFFAKPTNVASINNNNNNNKKITKEIQNQNCTIWINITLVLICNVNFQFSYITYYQCNELHVCKQFNAINISFLKPTEIITNEEPIVVECKRKYWPNVVQKRMGGGGVKASWKFSFLKSSGQTSFVLIILYPL